MPRNLRSAFVLALLLPALVQAQAPAAKAPPTVMHRAWAAYDAKAVGTRLGGNGKPATDVKTAEVALQLPTFSATAEMAAMSRLWGRYGAAPEPAPPAECGK